MERIDVAFLLANNGNGPDVLRLSVALGPLPPLAHSTTNSFGITLLHVVATGMGRTLCWNRPYSFEVPSHGFVKDPNGMKAKQSTLEGSDLLLSNI